MSHKLGIWKCKIGQTNAQLLPNAADAPMRKAVAEAYQQLIGHDHDFIFSGWGVGQEFNKLLQYEELERKIKMDAWIKPKLVRLKAENKRLRDTLEQIERYMEDLEKYGDDDHDADLVVLNLVKSTLSNVEV